MFNTMNLNPGYVGTSGLPNFSIESPIAENGQGLGLSIINDQIGPSSETVLAIAIIVPYIFPNKSQYL